MQMSGQMTRQHLVTRGIWKISRAHGAVPCDSENGSLIFREPFDECFWRQRTVIIDKKPIDQHGSMIGKIVAPDEYNDLAAESHLKGLCNNDTPTIKRATADSGDV